MSHLIGHALCLTNKENNRKVNWPFDPLIPTPLNVIQMYFDFPCDCEASTYLVHVYLLLFHCVLCGWVYLLFVDANCDVMFTYILRRAAVGTGAGWGGQPPPSPILAQIEAKASPSKDLRLLIPVPPADFQIFLRPCYVQISNMYLRLWRNQW